MLRTQDGRQAPPPVPRWQDLKSADLWRWPLPELPRATDRILTRLFGLVALAQVAEVEGWERARAQHDPFVLVANHSSRREVALLSAVLLLARGGRPVRFLADWNFRLIPGLGRLYDRCGVITLTRKDAKPRFLNRLRPLFESPIAAHDLAQRHLLQGGAIGVFPEGTVNRDGARLLRGRRGAARLSLATGAPVLPVGLRFARHHAADGSVDAGSPMRIELGEPMPPPAALASPSRGQVTDWHAELMTAIAHLSGKHWPGPTEAKARLSRSRQRFAPPERGGAPC